VHGRRECLILCGRVSVIGSDDKFEYSQSPLIDDISTGFER
jgi:hypothetical protein